jgi:two-component system phosphate regulon sensor histidine kinase PhoR
MTHELKTPISSASIAIEMLENKQIPLSEEKRDLYLKAARSEINRLENLVESTLMLTTLEQEQVTLSRSEVNVKAWIEEILIGIYPFLERHHAIATFMDLPGGFSVCIDKLHFTNVIHNILENAVKYNDKKIPEIHISARKTEEYVILSITDNGLGISKRDRERIFDKFFRVSQGDKHTTKGYGIGLSYVKTIVTLHGGSIEVKSTPGEGSEFIIKIP